MTQGSYQRAGVCRRGHVESRDIGFNPPGKRCSRCGAEVLTACPECGAQIRGPFDNPTITVLGGSYDPPTFCFACGAPFPWLDRQGRIYLLENMLDEQDLDPADELTVREQLEALRSPDLDDEETKRRWTRVRELAPGLWEQGKPILDSVVSAAIKSQMGL
jgi:hypothetical protein